MPARKQSFIHANPWQLISRLSFLLLFFYLTPTPATAQQSLEPVTLQLKWKHQFQFAGYYMALEKGYYKEAGLDVTIQPHSRRKIAHCNDAGR